ncbi:HupE/UreJ protein [Alteromonadaceae bacterium 2753L.S.0a.02]|nr:HupE/UreJ protein [Alteromonadaceae bacterium 2753L.S.0a.02]
MKTIIRYFVFGVCAFLAVPICSHEARPVSIQITEQTSADRTFYAVEWQVPLSVADTNLPSLKLPRDCRSETNVALRKAQGAYRGKAYYLCEHALTGRSLAVYFPQGNPAISTLIRVKLNSGEQQSALLKPGDTQWQLPRRETPWRVIVDYTRLGIAHIWMGTDHLLFVACLIFIAQRWRRILITVTGFTAAHSVTLVLASLNWVRLPIPPVEASIALSILFLAHEIANNKRFSWTYRYPIVVSSCFGLLHGFGFAEALRELGLPQTQRLSSLLFFNVGVEIGQIIFILCLAGFYYALIYSRSWFAALHTPKNSVLAQKIITYIIGALASYWFVVRILSF